ncbi:MAG: response regulator [Deltaproteobacteria bacterium]|nr:response regulator [Deltaproteobacteria bacterium]
MRGTFRTLVVEDSSSMRRLLCELLRERNYDVVAVETAEDALRAHLETRFGLMLVDWTLPGMSGLDLCRAVRAREGGEDVVILVITGRNRAEDLNQVLDAGASDYLAKPIDAEILGTRLLIAERTIRDSARRTTEREDMQSRLVFADRMASVGTLAAGVAHELNNPLMYVLSNLHLTREELEVPNDGGWIDRAKQQIDEAIHGAVRMQNIVRDLKTFSRVDDEQRGNVDVRGVLESSINMCWNQIRHRATLKRDIAQTPLIEVNESRLGQVFLNLLINAAQAMPEEGIDKNLITVRTYTDSDGWAIIEVIDNGTGIAPETRGHIFDPFFTTKGIAEGTGLGLSICRNIIQSAGGSIDAESEVDRGTTFRVKLPPSTRTYIPLMTRAPPMVHAGARARVVVIDDEPLVGRSIQRALRHHDVQVFLNGKEAIEALCAGEPCDVVFCDLMMPGVSGMEVFATVAQRRPEIASRFVFITGGAFTPQAREFLKQTPLVCLEKPFEIHQIRDLVRERAEPAVG